MFSPGSLKPPMPATPGYFAWGCFRYFGLVGTASPAIEKPRLAAGPSLLSLLSLNSGFGLVTALALLIGVLGLTVRILLLLAGLLAAALLLAGLLTRVLILLTRFRVLLARLVLVGHRISFVERNQR
jgi:hypothetical protein